ncbi:hypothetical protein ACPA9J_22055 [Pseudomonas aeruginosa]
MAGQRDGRQQEPGRQRHEPPRSPDMRRPACGEEVQAERGPSIPPGTR